MITLSDWKLGLHCESIGGQASIPYKDHDSRIIATAGDVVWKKIYDKTSQVGPKTHTVKS